MKYKKGYKYQLVEDFVYVVPIQLRHVNVKEQFITLMDGSLTIHKGYAWDGASGIPDIANKKAALIHDALYQLIRKKALDKGSYKNIADRIFEHYCVLEGTPEWLAGIYYKGLKKFGDKAATKGRKIYES